MLPARVPPVHGARSSCAQTSTYQRASDRAIAQAASRRLLNAEDQVRTQSNLCGICGGQSDTETGFLESFVLPCVYLATVSR
jgi:hypothetical protein